MQKIQKNLTKDFQLENLVKVLNLLQMSNLVKAPSLDKVVLHLILAFLQKYRIKELFAFLDFHSFISFI